MEVGVIGGGPVGLYAAFRLVQEGHQVTMYEKGDAIAGNVRSWNFVRLFSKLELNLPQDARDILKAAGHELPDEEAYLTGGDFVSMVLEPLAGWLSASGKCDIKKGWEVLSIGRGRLLKSDAIMAVGDKRRKDTKFRLLLRSGSQETSASFDVVVDASGNYAGKTGNKVGIGGICAPGENAAEGAGLLKRVIPDVKGVDKPALVGKRVGVIGTGYSAITCLRDLHDIAREGNGPAEVIWFTRRPEASAPYSIMENDPLPQRAELAKLGNSLANSSANAESTDWGETRFTYVPAMACTSIEMIDKASLKLTLEVDNDSGQTERNLELDILFSLTGFHPDKELWNEIHVHTCYASDGPMKLAQSLLAAKMAMEGGGADAGDCLKQAAPGPATLENPEPNFFVLGMKSYGRNSSFLMRVGYEQVGLLMGRLAENAA